MAHNYNTGYAVVTGNPNGESTLQGGTIKYAISSDGTQRWVFKDGNVTGSKWELLPEGINFADEDGNVQYSGDTDKREGYYDTTNEVYYPNLTVYAEGVFNNFSIDNSDKLIVINRSSFSSGFFEYADGLTLDIVNKGINSIKISANLDIFTRDANASIKISSRINIDSNGEFTWVDTDAITASKDLSNYIVKVFFGRDKDNKPFIGASIRQSGNTGQETELYFSNMNISYRRNFGSFEISDFYNSIEQKTGMNNSVGNTSNFYIGIDVLKEYNDMLPIGNILIEDGTLNPFFDKDLVYDSVAKKYGYVDRVDGVEFKDADGNLKYSSTEDKRTGYYDSVNEVYYPNIMREGSRIIMNPKDAFFTQSAFATGISKYLIELPDNQMQNFSFDIDIWDIVGQGGAEKTSTKIRVSSYSLGSDRWYATILKSNDVNVSYKWQLEYGYTGGNTRRAITLRKVGINYISPIRISVSNLIVTEVNSSFDVLNSAYSGWTISFLNNGTMGLVQGTIDEKDMLPFGKLELNDANGDAAYDKEIVYNPTTKEYGTKDISSGLPVGFYEEGTWTPILKDAISGNIYTYNTLISSYIRTGNMVFIDLNITEIETVGTPNGAVVIEGIPFQVAQSYPLTNSSIARSNVDFNDYRAYVSNNGNRIQFAKRYTTGFGFDSYITVTFTDGTINVSAYYKTNVYTP